MRESERQVAVSLSDIREDHLARYRWASEFIGSSSVLDIGAGVGYGRTFFDGDVTSIEIDDEAIAWGRKHFQAEYQKRDLSSASCFVDIKPHDVAVAFEVIEHLPDPKVMLERIPSNVLYASVPNENVFKYHAGIAYHYRHYTPNEFKELLNASGWAVTEMLGQKGPYSQVEADVSGRTVIARCIRHAIAIPSKPDRGDLVTHVRGERSAYHHLGAWA